MNGENRRIRPEIIVIVLAVLLIIAVYELNSSNNKLTELKTSNNTVITGVTDVPSYTLNETLTEQEQIKIALDKLEQTQKQLDSDKNNIPFVKNVAVMILISLTLTYIIKQTILLKGDRGLPIGSQVGTQKKSEMTVDKEKLKVCLSDIKGHSEILEDIRSVIDFIKNPYKYSAMGARLPRGILLFGPPGTGKTMIAKAVAKESGVSFISASGSDFVEKYVGVGAKRVRELFEEARKQAPCIVFIDEVDAIGRARNADENNSESSNTLNALLTEMDGFGTAEGVFVLASTNRIDILDPALTRAGRFDKHIAVQLPDIEGRYDILKIYAKNKPLDKDIDLKHIAKTTTNLSGADLENLMNEASIKAVRRGSKIITNTDIDNAMYGILVKGRQKDKYSRTEQENTLVAYHEAGHVLTSILLSDVEVTKVTIIPSTSGAGGITFTNPKDKLLMSKTDLENQIKMLYSGRAAEYILTGSEDSVTTGAHNDIERATSLLYRMITEFGMCEEFGLINRNIFRNSSEKVEVKLSEMSLKYYNESIEFLKLNMGKLVSIADKLIEKETLQGTEIIEIITQQNNTPSNNKEGYKWDQEIGYQVEEANC